MRWILVAALLLGGCATVREEKDCRMRCLWCVYVDLDCDTEKEVTPTNDENMLPVSSWED